MHAIIETMITTMIASIRGIHIGDNTHTHDHLITLHNFNTMNVIVNAPQNVIPPALPLDEFVSI
jgi:hypothetical protein